MKKIIYLFLLSLLIFSCASQSKSDFLSIEEILTEDSSFLFGTFMDNDFIIRLKNLDTKEKTDVRFSGGYDVQMLKLDPGDYVIVGIIEEVTSTRRVTSTNPSGYGGFITNSYSYSSKTPVFAEIPTEVMDIIEIRSGQATYVGDFAGKPRNYFKGIKSNIYFANQFELSKERLIQKFPFPENFQFTSAF